ncbi:MAG: hypothetical protein P8182_00355 [Deltaproteobacteria bacterium]
MASIFREFSITYARFMKEFPDHPLTDEIRRVIAGNKLPNEQWLKLQTKRMKDLMIPFWLQA